MSNDPILSQSVIVSGASSVLNKKKFELRHKKRLAVGSSAIVKEHKDHSILNQNPQISAVKEEEKKINAAEYNGIKVSRLTPKLPYPPQDAQYNLKTEVDSDLSKIGGDSVNDSFSDAGKQHKSLEFIDNAKLVSETALMSDLIPTKSILRASNKDIQNIKRTGSSVSFKCDSDKAKSVNSICQ